MSGTDTMPCNHLFVDGFGGMGDALVCCKCGLDRYPEAMPFSVLIAKIQGNIIREGNTCYNVYAELARKARHERQTKISNPE